MGAKKREETKMRTAGTIVAGAGRIALASVLLLTVLVPAGHAVADDDAMDDDTITISHVLGDATGPIPVLTSDNEGESLIAIENSSEEEVTLRIRADDATATLSFGPFPANDDGDESTSATPFTVPPNNRVLALLSVTNASNLPETVPIHAIADHEIVATTTVAISPRPDKAAADLTTVTVRDVDGAGPVTIETTGGGGDGTRSGSAIIRVASESNDPIEIRLLAMGNDASVSFKDDVDATLEWFVVPTGEAQVVAQVSVTDAGDDASAASVFALARDGSTQQVGVISILPALDPSVSVRDVVDGTVVVKGEGLTANTPIDLTLTGVGKSPVLAQVDAVVASPTEGAAKVTLSPCGEEPSGTPPCEMTLVGGERTPLTLTVEAADVGNDYRGALTIQARGVLDDVRHEIDASFVAEPPFIAFATPKPFRSELAFDNAFRDDKPETAGFEVTLWATDGARHEVELPTVAVGLAPAHDAEPNPVLYDVALGPKGLTKLAKDAGEAMIMEPSAGGLDDGVQALPSQAGIVLTGGQQVTIEGDLQGVVDPGRYDITLTFSTRTGTPVAVPVQLLVRSSVWFAVIVIAIGCVIGLFGQAGLTRVASRATAARQLDELRSEVRVLRGSSPESCHASLDELLGSIQARSVSLAWQPNEVQMTSWADRIAIATRWVQLTESLELSPVPLETVQRQLDAARRYIAGATGATKADADVALTAASTILKEHGAVVIELHDIEMLVDGQTPTRPQGARGLGEVTEAIRKSRTAFSLGHFEEARDQLTRAQLLWSAYNANELQHFVVSFPPPTDVDERTSWDIAVEESSGSLEALANKIHARITAGNGDFDVAAARREFEAVDDRFVLALTHRFDARVARIQEVGDVPADVQELVARVTDVLAYGDDTRSRETLRDAIEELESSSLADDTIPFPDAPRSRPIGTAPTPTGLGPGAPLAPRVWLTGLQLGMTLVLGGLALVLIVIIGVAALYEPNPTWGSLNDILVAATYGLGLEASAISVAGLLAVATKNAPKAPESED